MPYAPVPGKLPPPRPDLSFTKRPKSKTREFIWRWRIWIEATFALTVYEPWEKVVVLTIFAILVMAMLTLIVNYLPRQLMFMSRRTMYYLWGEDWEGRALWSYLGLVNEDINEGL